MKRISGIVLLAGSLLALAAIIPLTMIGPVFDAESEAEQAQIIEDHETEWDVSSFLLGFGGIGSAIGLGLFGGYLWNTDTDLSLKLQAYLAIAIAIIGAAIWAIICYNRIVQNPQELVGNLNLNDTMYAIYTVFTASAQVVLGFVLSRIGFPRVGWGVLILGLVSGALFIAIGDHYPLLHYLIFLPMGVALSR